MIPVIVSDGVVVGCVLGVAYCLGGLHGLILAWSHPARMRRWAGMVERTATRLLEAEERAAQKIAEKVDQ